MHSTHSNIIRGLSVPVAALVCLIMIAFAAAPAPAASPAHTAPRTCFPAATWDGEDGYRPCVKVHVYEDGSFSYTVRDAGGTDSSPVFRYSGSVGATDR